MDDVTQRKHAATPLPTASQQAARAATATLIGFKQAADMLLTCILIGFGLGLGGFLAYWLVRGLWLLLHGHL